MNKVAPKLIAINQFGRRLNAETKITTPNLKVTNSNQKKVKFDLATVSFQVNYDQSSGHHHRGHQQRPIPTIMYPLESRIPLWRAHLTPPPSLKSDPKSNIFIHIFRHMTFFQWIKLFFTLFVLFQLIVQSYQLISLYRRKFSHSFVNHHLPADIVFPAITLCLPIIIPFQESDANRKCSKLANFPIENVDHHFNDDDDGENDGQPEERHQTQSSVNMECTNSLPIVNLFNQSMSEYGHQCRVRFKRLSTSTFKTISCSIISPPIESYFQNKRCFSYLSEIVVFRSMLNSERESSNSILDHRDIYITLLIQSNRVPIGSNSEAILPELFIHSADKIPIDSIRSPVKLELNHHYMIEYYYLKTLRSTDQWSFFHCHNYSNRNAFEIQDERIAHQKEDSITSLDLVISRQDCLDRCILRQQRLKRLKLNCPKQEDCISNQIPIRKDLVHLTKNQICLTSSDECPNNDEDSLIQSVLDQCDRDCPDDCSTIDVQHETTNDIDQTIESAPSDNMIQVTIKRKITPDIDVNHYPLINWNRLLSDIGGLIAFWFAMVWIVFQLCSIFDYLWDLIQLRYL